MPVSLLSLSPDLAGPDALNLCVEDAARLGFGGLLWRSDKSLVEQGAPPPHLVAAARGAGLGLVVEAEFATLPLSHPLVEAHPELFSIRRRHDGDGPVDPRTPFAPTGVAVARPASAGASEELGQLLEDGLDGLLAAGVNGLLLPDTGSVQVMRRALADVARSEAADCVLLARADDMEPAGIGALAVTGLDGLVLKNGSVEPGLVFSGAAPCLVEVDAREGRADLARQLMTAAMQGAALILPAWALEQDDELRDMVARSIALAAEIGRFPGESRSLTGPGSPVMALLRGNAPDMRVSDSALLTVFNRTNQAQPVPDPASLAPFMGADFEAFAPDHASGWGEPLEPFEARLFRARRAAPVTLSEPVLAERGATADRLVIEDLRPRVDGGDFPVKRIVGEAVTVEVALFGDGHEQLAAELCWRAADAGEWRRLRMEQLPNDQWHGAFQLERLGRHEFFVEGWLDRFGGFRRDFTKKLQAEVAQPVDHAEGVALVEAALARASGEVRAGLDSALAELRDAGSDERSAALLLASGLAALMDAADDRPHRIRSGVQRVDAERTAAGFSSWYELFPRSQSDSPARHGTFDDVIARLPAVRDMGFDTLYFPPIHPIGRANRKGRNNTLTPGPDDPGSPYAIGAPEGGHDAIHPELGTFADFARLIDAARAHGLEIALDFAIQCSPDHPWLKEHPGWFAWRPDGSMKYAENPPKKYQDIVNVDFYGPDAVPDLWVALRDVILLWVSHGVKTFRVDNPHTKPLPFWEWMIGDVRARHPEVIFLAEAFTRPAMMYRLAKIGFSQSYTYFTWRDRKQELTDYIVELTTTAPREFYRPHFFVNTPDINPIFLQTSGRPGFRIRAVLAATLSGLFGVYSGFELCEAAPVPGKEEYLDSEKYEIKPRDWQAPGNIIADITLLNRLRRSYPALQTHLNTRFYLAHNEQIIWYGKSAPDGSHMVMVMVSLDPHHAQATEFEVPLWEFGLPDAGSVAVEDLAEGHRFRWQGKTQNVRLDPEQPYRIWRIAPGVDA